MNSHVVFAVNRKDAMEKCAELELPFDHTTWVMNIHLLGDVALNSITPQFTDLFKEMPAYREAALAFGLDPEA